MDFKLAKVINYDGKEISELKLDFDKLTGQDLLDAEAELLAEKKAPPVKEFNKGYLAIVGAKAASVPTDMIKLLGARDFTQFTMHVQNFLITEE